MNPDPEGPKTYGSRTLILKIICLLIPVRIRERKKGKKGKKVLGTCLSLFSSVILYYSILVSHVCCHGTILKLAKTRLFHKEMVMFCHILEGILIKW
jgi:hypothetical protein